MASESVETGRGVGDANVAVGIWREVTGTGGVDGVTVTDAPTMAAEGVTDGEPVLEARHPPRKTTSASTTTDRPFSIRRRIRNKVLNSNNSGLYWSLRSPSLGSRQQIHEPNPAGHVTRHPIIPCSACPKCSVAIIK